MSQGATAEALWAFTEAHLPMVRQSAQRAFAAGKEVTEVIGLITDGSSRHLPAMAQVVTRRWFGFPKALDLIRGHGGEGPAIAARLAQNDPHTLYVLTFFNDLSLLTEIPVTTVIEGPQ